MANITTNALQLHLQIIIRYLKPFLPFANCHMVNYLTDNLWATYVPEEIRREIESPADIDEAIRLFWRHRDFDASSGYQQFQNFVTNYQQFTLDGLHSLWLSLDELNDQLENDGCQVQTDSCLPIKDFMSAKKCSEVKIEFQFNIYRLQL